MVHLVGDVHGPVRGDRERGREAEAGAHRVGAVPGETPQSVPGDRRQGAGAVNPTDAVVGVVGDEDRAVCHGHVRGEGQLSVRRGPAVPGEPGHAVARHGARQAASVRRLRRTARRGVPGRHAATTRLRRGRTVTTPATSPVHSFVSRIHVSFRTVVGISPAYRSEVPRRSSHRAGHSHEGGTGRDGRRGDPYGRKGGRKGGREEGPADADGFGRTRMDALRCASIRRFTPRLHSNK